jgi:hypothetical protein
MARRRRLRRLYCLHYYATTMHKMWVLIYILGFCLQLLARAIRHDLSKYREPEALGFALNLSRLKKSKYGTPEYRRMAYRRTLRPAIQHHYENNRHHPEYHPNGIAGMALADLCMMFFDWMASVKRNEKGHIVLSIEAGQKRFDIPPVLSKIFLNTAGKAKYL